MTRNSTPSSAKSVYRIAQREVRDNLPSAARRSILSTIFVALLLGVIVSQGLAISGGLFTVGVSQSSPYHDAVSGSYLLSPTSPNGATIDSGEVDVLITDGEVSVADSLRGQAASDALATSVDSYNARHAGDSVSLSTTQVDTSHSVGLQDPFPPSEDFRDRVHPVIQFILTSFGILLYLGSRIVTDLLALIDSLVIFAKNGYMEIPLSKMEQFGLVATFVTASFGSLVQTYSRSVYRDRPRIGGVSLRSTPIDDWTILTGKTAPYAIIGGLLSAAAGVALGSLTVTLSFATLVFAVIGVAFLSAMFASSTRTRIVLTALSTFGIALYTIVPAIFAPLHPLSYTSPLSVLVVVYSGESLTTAELGVAILPLVTCGILSFSLGARMYHSSVDAPIEGVQAAISATSGVISGYRSVLLLAAVVYPVAYAIELFLASSAFLFAPASVSGLFFLGIAIIEEFVKAIPIYAAFSRRDYPDEVQHGILTGGISGLGFFLSDQLVAILQPDTIQQFVPLRVLSAIGTQSVDVFGPAGTFFLFLSPLILHTLTGALLGLGIRTDETKWILGGIGVAISTHVFYTSTVVMSLV